MSIKILYLPKTDFWLRPWPNPNPNPNPRKYKKTVYNREPRDSAVNSIVADKWIWTTEPADTWEDINQHSRDTNRFHALQCQLPEEIQGDNDGLLSADAKFL